MVTVTFRSVCVNGSSPSVPGSEVEGQPRLLDRDWNNACTFAMDISWAVCGWGREGGQKAYNPYIWIYTVCVYIYIYLDVLPILRLQQALVISFNAKWKVRTGRYVSPVTSHRHFVSSLSTHTHTHIHVIAVLLHCVASLKQTHPHLTEQSWWQQARVGCLVGTFPHVKCQTSLPPLHILLFVDDATLQTQYNILYEAHDYWKITILAAWGDRQTKQSANKCSNTPFSCSFIVRSQSKQPCLES